MLVEELAVSAGAVAPVGDGPLVEPEGGDDGLDRTAVSEQGDDDGDQVERRLQAVERVSRVAAKVRPQVEQR